MNNHSNITLKMVSMFRAAPASVYDAWINPEIMKKWLFTSEETNQVIQNNPQVGGLWKIIDHRDGQEYKAIGEYIEVNFPSKLVFTFKMPQFNELEDTLLIEFKKMDDGCEMNFSHEMNVPLEQKWTKEDMQKVSKESKEETEHGWALMFENLKTIVE